MTLRTPADLHGYQTWAIQRAAGPGDGPCHAMEWLDMGLGKTVIALSVIADLQDQGRCTGALVLAPLRVIQMVWRQEAAHWSHLSHLRFALVNGAKKTREKALARKADVYLATYESLLWLVPEIETRYLGRGVYPPFNLVVFDEVSKLKNMRSRAGVARGKALLRLLPYLEHRIGLTGTPASNGWMDIFGQFLAVDGGNALGTSFTAFQKEFFFPTDYMQYNWEPKPHALDHIKARIAPITISLAKRDYLDMPPMVIPPPLLIRFPPALQARYDAIEAEEMLELASGRKVEVLNQVSLLNRCLQFGQGACYRAPGDPNWEEIHGLKLDALDEIVAELQGKPLLVAVGFKHDAERIVKRFKGAESLHSGLSEAKVLDLQERWDRGEIPLLVGHPDTFGHGLNLQVSCHHIAWFGLTWALDYYDQANARLDRQGQTETVFVYRILIEDTVDQAQLKTLEAKAQDEYVLRQVIEEYWQHKKSKRTLEAIEFPGGKRKGPSGGEGP